MIRFVNSIIQNIREGSLIVTLIPVKCGIRRQVSSASPHEITLVWGFLKVASFEREPSESLVIEHMTLMRPIIDFDRMVSKQLLHTSSTGSNLKLKAINRYEDMRNDGALNVFYLDI